MARIFLNPANVVSANILPPQEGTDFAKATSWSVAFVLVDSTTLLVPEETEQQCVNLIAAVGGLVELS